MQEKLMNISSYTSKLLRRKFGRGPESCHASAGLSFIVIYIRGFISPMEEVLLNQEQDDMVDHARRTIISGALEEIRGVIQVTLGVMVSDYYQDWNFPNNSGIIVAVIEQSQGMDWTAQPAEQQPRPHLDALEREVARLSALTEKIPENVETFQVTPKIFIVMRNGILVPIEKALVLKGFECQLLVTKDDMEKTYFHRDGRFSEIFANPVADIFFDWSLKDDKGLVCFILK